MLRALHSGVPYMDMEPCLSALHRYTFKGKFVSAAGTLVKTEPRPRGILRHLSLVVCATLRPTHSVVGLKCKRCCGGGG